jgi:Rrf2 family protein
MKLSSQEEYGLRCLLQIGRQAPGIALTIPEISQAEGISKDYAAKLLRVLRRGGLIKSARGQAGGYTLARPAEQITIGEALAALGGRLYEPGFCQGHTGVSAVCNRSVDCSVRSLWRAVQELVDQVLSKTTLKDLMLDEQQAATHVNELIEATAIRPAPPAQQA